MTNDFAGSAVRAGDFYNFCEQNGYSLDKVLTSTDFQKDSDKFAASKLADAGLLDPQFASALPSDGTVAKSILPFTFLAGSALAFVLAKPNAVVREHAHTKGSLRIILSGEYKFTGLPAGDMTLKAGDWIYIPKGQKYGYVTGPDGAASACPYCPWGRD